MPGFGKDPNDLNRVIPFGGGTMSQRERYFAQQEAKARENRKAGGNAPFWKDTFRLPKDHTRMGRLIPEIPHPRKRLFAVRAPSVA